MLPLGVEPGQGHPPLAQRRLTSLIETKAIPLCHFNYCIVYIAIPVILYCAILCTITIEMCVLKVVAVLQLTILSSRPFCINHSLTETILPESRSYQFMFFSFLTLVVRDVLVCHHHLYLYVNDVR